MLGLGLSLPGTALRQSGSSVPPVDPAFIVTHEGEPVTHNGVPVTVEFLFDPETLVTHEGAVVTEAGEPVTVGA